MKYSIIIPVYNRPEEIDELLESLTNQTFMNFEVLIVEDGSQIKCESIIVKYKSKVDIKYYYKDNSGPGLSRNYGSNYANGEYLIFLDSDCILHENYLQEVENGLKNNYSDAFGGPDKAHPSFTNLQKAINYSMTSFFTTGGIRGGKKQLDKFYPRSFNMGYSKKVYETTKGFSSIRFGEDIDMSLRILKNGFTTMLIEKAYVYHKRRTDFRKFFKQVFNSGIARINLYKRHPQSLKIVHLLPSIFTIGFFCCLIFSILLNKWFITPVLFFILIISLDSFFKNKSISVGLLSVPASFIQLTGYGCGFIYSFWKRIILKRDEFASFVNNFYK
ncbi:MAG: glycosyltransferase [Bacteroidales bacterium]|nr:glycosyltransferase [Bacteroidales bacterium]